MRKIYERKLNQVQHSQRVREDIAPVVIGIKTLKWTKYTTEGAKGNERILPELDPCKYQLTL